MDIAELIKTAKIGRERKDAQVETCAPFAAALYDVLADMGIETQLYTACHRSPSVHLSWYHLVVEHEGVYYDSLGEFSVDILRKRLKYHATSKLEIQFQAESRLECYDEDDYGMLHEFLLKQFRKAAKVISEDTRQVAFTP